MRLLDTQVKPLRLVDVPGPEFPEVPPYVILSHTWGPEEVTLQDIQGSIETAAKKKGFAKIKGCCAKAGKDGHRFAWIDTCCIDKTNSVELSEAINSMYQWYRDASICYALLADVPTRWAVVAQFESDHFDAHHYLKNSRWFKRGWTLQELIAPDIVEFYAMDWTFLGTKSSLRMELASITGIDEDILGGGQSHFNRCVAERMSWAATRSTTRIEDEAYCLLGVFDVNMPLIYGEGRKAFLRLQEEILKSSEDYTILAWGLGDLLTTPPPLPLTSVNRCCNPLADMVSRFQENDHFQYSSLEIDHARFHSGHNSWDNPPPSMTGRGLFVSLPLSSNRDHSQEPYLAYIGCRLHGKSICIPLVRLNEYGSSIFSRVSGPPNYVLLNPEETEKFKMTPMYITQQKRETRSNGQDKFSGEYTSVIYQEFDHCSAWRDSHPDIKGNRLFISWDVESSPYFLPCITDDKEIFVIVLTKDGGNIVPMELPESAYELESAEAILKGGFWGWRPSVLTQNEMQQLMDQYEVQDHATCKFTNCAVSIMYKRRPYAFDVEISSWSTVPSDFHRRQMKGLIAEFGDAESSHDTSMS